MKILHPHLDAVIKQYPIALLFLSGALLPALAADAPLAPAVTSPSQTAPAQDAAVAQAQNDVPDRATILAAMKKAADFMQNKASYKGGYVWSYLADLSRRWGEMEAYPTMIWMQSPGSTEDVGDLFLDAYHATGDEYFYNAAEKVADALVMAQKPAGGWNYIADLSGEETLKKWYATIGKNGWRLEEFQHYYGNSTYDDNVSSNVATFMLRMYLQKKDPKYKASMDKAIQFVLDSQYKNGGWPQRYPPMGNFSKGGLPDYTGFITFNDNVTSANVDLLLLCYQLFGDKKYLDPIQRGMNVYVTSQQPKPQAGWGLQHTPDDLKPASARTYEPKALVSHTTQSNINELIKFYYLTGDKKFLARIPEAIEWLDSIQLEDGRFPTFTEVGTNKPLFIHRTGSNVVNGHYFVDDNPQGTIGHYSSFRSVNTNQLRQSYDEAMATAPEPLAAASPFGPNPPKFDVTAFINTGSTTGNSDGGGGRGGFGGGRGGRGGSASDVIAYMTPEGYWPSQVSLTNPYIGDGPMEVAEGNFATGSGGDKYDTSPGGRGAGSAPGFTTSSFINNMRTLMRAYQNTPATATASTPAR